MKRIKTIIFATMIATTTMAQGVIDVHSHIITPEFVSALDKEGQITGRGIPLAKIRCGESSEMDGRGGCADIGSDISSPTADIS